MKVAIIGYSGSGKSTLADFLGKKYGIPVLYLDQVHWLPDWKERPPEEKSNMILSYLEGNDSWIIDGNYTKLYQERRLQESDQIIFMNFSRFSCLYRVWKRYLSYKGKSRESMTEGCPEKIDWEFTRWVLHDGRDQKHKRHYQSIVKQFRGKMVIISNQRQLTRFMKSFRAS